MPTISPEKTAIKRTRLSLPTRLAVDHEFVTPGTTVLDYGCGRGDDVRLLRQQGHTVVAYDPYYNPSPIAPPVCDVVLLNYVLNVIADPVERYETLQWAWHCANYTLIVAVRPRLKPQRGWVPHNDGYLTTHHTFQVQITPDYLVEHLLNLSYVTTVHTLATHVFAVEKGIIS